VAEWLGTARANALLTTREILKIIRFFIVGISATAVHMFFAWFASRSGFGDVVSSVTGFIPALGVSYLGHYFFSFRSDARHGEAFVRFASVASGSFCVSLLLLVFLRDWMPQLSLFISIALIPAVSYVVNRMWVFRS
jgi:putative flippase GtrA